LRIKEAVRSGTFIIKKDLREKEAGLLKRKEEVRRRVKGGVVKESKNP